MKKRLLILTMILTLCVGTVIPAQAANVFAFTEKSVTLFEGETAETALRREGSFEGDGDITYASSKPAVATVAEDGTITAVAKGKAEVTASLVRNGKTAAKAKIAVTVLRAVTKVTLDTTKLAVYEPDDPLVAPLLKRNAAEPEETQAPEEALEPEETQEPAEAAQPEEPETEANRVLLVPAGSGVALAATCTPEDASSKKVNFTTTDAGIARISGANLKAVQSGECDLIIASDQNPEVTEIFRVLVIKPVKKIQISAGDKKVPAGATLQLSAVCTPEDASITKVTWSSKNEEIATVDEDGLVTGVKKGTVSIIATAADGSKTAGSVSITVTQPVEGITLAEDDVTVNTGKSVQLKATILPKDATDKTLTWTSSDEEIATVRNGQVTGKKAGSCTVTCTSNSDPEVSATATVTVHQLVTKIECVNEKEELELRVGESVELKWNVLPDDATNTELSFRSQHPRVATVDENGVVTAVGRGTATIVATAQDGSKRQGTVKITVIQQVTGVSMKQDLYYVQKGRHATVVAVVEPKNANNQRVTWSTDDETVATARSNGTSTGSVTGVDTGETTVWATTEDGGYTASARIKVGDFNGAVQVEELRVTGGTNILISMRNMSQDITFENIHFMVELFDLHGEAIVCNADGESTYFEGDYNYELGPLERTSRTAFRFRNAVIDEEIGGVILTVTSWRDTDGITWKIPEADRVPAEWYEYRLYDDDPLPDDGDEPDYGEGVG